MLLAGVDQAQQQITAGDGKEQAEQDHRPEQRVGEGVGRQLRLPEVFGDPQQLQQQLQAEQQNGKAQQPIDGGQPLVAPELPDKQRNLQREHAGEHDDPAVHIKEGLLQGGQGKQDETAEGNGRHQPAQLVGFTAKEVAHPPFIEQGGRHQQQVGAENIGKRCISLKGAQQQAAKSPCDNQFPR